MSAVIATRDRPEPLRETLADVRALDGLREIVVVDDGSRVAVGPDVGRADPRVRLLRTKGIGRSGARNLGARSATGDLLLFLDDDMTPGSALIEAHRAAHGAWGNALVVGAIRLAPASQTTPFGRFRQQLEDQGLPVAPGRAHAGICAAGNMSMRRDSFGALGGFDERLGSGEDQDLGHRHEAQGGVIVYAPAASAVHRDGALDIASYCRRAEWGARSVVPFDRLHASRPEARDRHRVNGWTRWGAEPPGLSLRKSLKAMAGRPWAMALLLRLTAALEGLGWEPTRLYTALLGVAIQRGYRRGLLDG